jgi:2-dehydropantoate 2-reductase
MEISALIGAVVELAALTQTQAPHISAVHACITLLGHVMHEQRVAFPPKPL